MPLPSQQHLDVGGRRALAAERPRVVDARFERVNRPAQRIDRQRRRDVRGARQRSAPSERQREHRRRRLCAVDEREPFLRAERDRRQPGRAASAVGDRLSAELRDSFSVFSASGCDVGFAFADQHQRQVRERREIAARADRSARRHARMDARVQQRDAALRASRLGCRRIPSPARSRAAPSSRARPATGSGSPTPAAWLRSRLSCSALERVGRNPDVGERSEAGVDAVGRLVALRAPSTTARAARTRARASGARPLASRSRLSTRAASSVRRVDRRVNAMTLRHDRRQTVDRSSMSSSIES